MTPRERVLAALDFKETDKIPFSLGFGINYPAKAAFAEHIGKSLPETEAFLSSLPDIRRAGAGYKAVPAERAERMQDGSYRDIWGVVRSPVQNKLDTFHEISHYPLADIDTVEGLLAYEFPKVEWFDYSGIAAQVASYNGEYAVMAGGGNIYETAWYMRGFEQMFVDVAAEPEYARYLLGKVTDFYVENAKRILEAGGGEIDLFFTADDIGGQQDLLMSLPLWEDIIKPFHKRLNDVIHNYGAKVVYHSDGAVIKAASGLIDMGVDVLEALQFDAAGMDPAYLKDNFGDRLRFHGGVSVQSTLPFGTPDEVEAEVAERVRVLGRGGGYILAPSHAVQAGTPPENIAAFLRAAGRAGGVV